MAAITSRIIAKFASANFLRQLLGLATGFLRPKLLTPELYGLWSLLKTVPNYASYAHLGSRESLRYLAPKHEADGRPDKAAEVEDTVFYGSLWCTLPVVLGLVAYAFWPGHSSELRFGLCATAAMVMLHWYFEFYINALKGRQNFAPAIYGNLLNAGCTLALSLVCITLFGFYGVYAAILLSLFGVLYYFQRKGVLRRHRTFDRKLFLQTVRMGFPIIGFNLITVLIRTSDRYVIAGSLGTEALGYYGISAMVLGVLMNVPGVSRDLNEPRIIQQIRDRTPEESFEVFFLRPLIYTATLMPLLIAPVYFGLPYAVDLLLPRYEQGVLPTQILATGAYFIALGYPARGMLIVHNAQATAMRSMAPVLLFAIVVNIIAVTSGFGLVGVAAGSTAAFAVLFAVLFALVCKCHHARPPGGRRDIFLIAGIFVAMCTALLLIGAMQTATTPILDAIIKILVFESVFLTIFFTVKRLRTNTGK